MPDWIGINSNHLSAFCGQTVPHTAAGGLNGTSVWAHIANEPHYMMLDLGINYNISTYVYP